MKSGRKIACPLLVLWGEQGNVGKLFDVMTIWREPAAAARVPTRPHSFTVSWWQ